MRLLKLTGISIGLILVVAGLISLLNPAPSLALPTYAAATGQSCATCHINPAGGGPRTAIGQRFEAIATHSTDPAGAWAQVQAQIAQPTATTEPPAATPTTAPAAATPTSPAAAPKPAATTAPAAKPTTKLPTTGDPFDIASLWMLIGGGSLTAGGFWLAKRRRG